jgi:hypothetical protein
MGIHHRNIRPIISMGYTKHGDTQITVTQGHHAGSFKLGYESRLRDSLFANARYLLTSLRIHAIIS